MFIRFKLPKTASDCILAPILPTAPENHRHIHEAFCNNANTLKDDHISHVALYGNCVYKLSYAKNVQEKCKVFSKRDRIRKEIAGNHYLRKIGVYVPNIQGSFLNFNPLKNVIGLIIMEWIPNVGPLNEYWQNANPSDTGNILQQFIAQTCALIDSKTQMNDYGPHNIIVSKTGKPYWLDAVAFQSKLSDKAYFERWSKQIQRVINSDARYWSKEQLDWVMNALSAYPIQLSVP